LRRHNDGSAGNRLASAVAALLVISHHRDLIVWQKGMDLVEEIHRLTRRFPQREAFGLSAQIARSAVSVVANIAEGRARSSRRDYAVFLSVARGSLMETDTLLAVAQRLGYVEPEDMRVAQGLIAEVSKMLSTLRRRLLEPKPETSNPKPKT